MFKKIFLIAALLFPALSVFAQDEEENEYFAYVTASGVNMRTKPSTSAPVGRKASKGDFFPISNTSGDWIEVEDSNGPDSNYYWISSKFVDRVKQTGITKADLKKDFSFDDGVVYGMLSFEDAGKDDWDNDVVEYTCLVKNREWQEAGGNGILINERGKVLYINGFLMQPEEYADGCSTVFDSSRNLLYYMGFLWKAE